MADGGADSGGGTQGSAGGRSASKSRIGRVLRPSGRALGQIAAGLFVTVVGGLAVYLLTLPAKSREAPFVGAIDANVAQPGGAAVFDVADAGGRAVGHIRISQLRSFVGFCIGAPVRSVATGVADERWFILPDHALVPAAVVDGAPPQQDQPSRCAGEVTGPTTLTLSAGVHTGATVLRAAAPGASVVGFAIRRGEATGWRGLGLVAAAAGGEFSVRVRVARPYVAIAAACWAQGTPAHPAGAREYVEEVLPLAGASARLRTAASTSVTEAARVACSPPASHVPAAPASRPAASREGAGTTSVQTVRVVTVPAPATAPATTSTVASERPPSGATPAPGSGREQALAELFALSPPATGLDAHDFDAGPGCSDDPRSPLEGCSDSPSIPAGDPPGACANGITVDRVTTTCGLAESAHAAYAQDGVLSAWSAERGRAYALLCRTAGAHTTGYTICLGRAGASELYVRWLR